jgi:alpha-D-xyloside xylohydrolase
MDEASACGAPVIRPMFFEFPGEEVCWDLKDQYMYGPDVLVAPVGYAQMRSREVYLPAGASWTDLHTGKVFEGGQRVSCEAPIERIPVFLKNGAHPEWIGKL